jgi:3D (Asp-Asp-Asp) domain-containing protein
MKQFLAHLIFTILVIAITLCFADEIDSYTIPPVYALPDKVTSYEPEVQPITMLATAYDLSIHCCGKPYGHPGRGITADGTNISRLSRTEAMTVATNDLPLGTKVKLTFSGNRAKYNGIYTVRDTGAMRSNVVDVYVGDFGELIGSETGEFGRHWVKVVVVE